MKQPVERRLAAILGANVAGYSRLMGADEAGTAQALREHPFAVLTDEMAPFRPRLEIEDIGEEFGRYPFVLRWDDRVIEFDTHLVLPSRFLILSRHEVRSASLYRQVSSPWAS
jgi:hypothetical protein